MSAYSGGYWWDVAVAPGAAVAFLEDVDECADAALNDCESMGDGGKCTNTDGGSPARQRHANRVRSERTPELLGRMQSSCAGAL